MSQAVKQLRYARGLLWIAAISVVATVIAMFVGICFLALISVPHSLVLLLMPAFLIQILVYAFKLTAPVTLALLPTSAVVFRNRTKSAMVVLPVIGLAGGGASIWLWHVVPSGSLPSGLGFKILLIAGMMAGFAAGAFVGRAIYEISK